MKALVAFVVLFLVGFLGLYFLLATAGVEGWWMFGALLALLLGGGGLFVLARDGLQAEAGYRKWRNTVEVVLLWAQRGRESVELRYLVGPLNDPVLLEVWDHLEGEHDES